MFHALHGFAGTVGAALLDQSVIAGVGNVLRAEALFLTGIHPSRPARSLERADFERLWGALTGLMRRSVDDGRVLSAPVPAGARATVAESDARMVYKQAAC